MRRAKKIDKNQPKIVKALRDTGFTVELDKDDIIVGGLGVSRWIEIKEKSPFLKNGKLEKGFIKDSQYKILWTWQGQYNICWSLDQILINYLATRNDNFPSGITPLMFRECYKEWLSEDELNRLRHEKIIQDGVQSD